MAFFERKNFSGVAVCWNIWFSQIEYYYFSSSFCLLCFRHWNRGENNSCARTDMHFKPVPDSPLARRRDDRLRKAAIEREESNLRQMAHAHQAQQAQAAHAAQQQQQEAIAKFNQVHAAQRAAAMQQADPFGAGANDPFAMHMRAAAEAAARQGTPHGAPARPMSRGGPTPPRPSPFPPGHPLGAQAASMEQHMKQMEQHMERERMERREQEALRLSIGGKNHWQPAVELHFVFLS